MGYFKFAFSSDMCFLIGACLQTYVAVVDWNEAKQNAAKTNDDDDWNDDVFHPGEAVYYAFNTLGPLFYLVNALVEVFRVLSSLRSKRCCGRAARDKYLGGQEAGMPAGDTTPLLSSMPSYMESKDTSSETANSSFDDCDESGSLAASSTSSSSSTSTETTETELQWELAAAIIFGVGATLEVYSTILDDVYDTDDDDDSTKNTVVLPWILTYGVINVISMHLYLLCGFVDLYSQRHALKCSTFQNFCTTAGAYNSYVFVGIICFVSGTILDCTMSFLYENKFVTDEVILAKCDLASCLLWNICAPVYIVADFILLHEEYGDEDKNLYHSMCNLLCSWCGRLRCCCCNGRKRQHEYATAVPDSIGGGSPRESILLEEHSMPLVSREGSPAAAYEDLEYLS